jgi:hypothetical protein
VVAVRKRRSFSATASWQLGFHHAFKAGISFGKDDMLIPDTKQAIVGETDRISSANSSSSTTTV